MIRIFFVYTLLLTGATFATNTQKIVSTLSEWADVANYITPSKKTYILTDLDDTLLRPIGHEGSTLWFIEQWNVHKTRGLSESQSLQEAVRDLAAAYDVIDFQLTEPTLCTVLEKTRTQDVIIHGLTARSFHLADITHKHCNQVGLCFDSIRHDCELIGECPVGHCNGIIFCGNTPKGKIASQIAQNWKNKDDVHVIFIDDSQKHVDSVVAELSGIVGKITGLHYCPNRKFE